MPLPKSVTKIKKDGVEFISSVDRIKYTLNELSRAALRDTAKLIRKRMLVKLRQLPGMKRSKRPYKSTQYWIQKTRNRPCRSGFKGTIPGTACCRNSARRTSQSGIILRGTVMELVLTIRQMQGQYLSALVVVATLILI